MHGRRPGRGRRRRPPAGRRRPDRGRRGRQGRDGVSRRRRAPGRRDRRQHQHRGRRGRAGRGRGPPRVRGRSPAPGRRARTTSARSTTSSRYVLALIAVDHVRAAGPHVPVAAAAAQGRAAQPVSLAAVFGVVVFFWQEGNGSEAIFGVSETGAITFWLPVLIFAFLFGLSMDYEVFILARMREEYDRTGSTADGRRHRARPHRPAGDVGRADPVLRLLGAGVASRAPTSRCWRRRSASASCIDATIVRALLVPALVIAVRPMELVAAGVAGQGPAGGALAAGAEGSRPPGPHRRRPGAGAGTVSASA